jgi:hypothetical protein
MNEYGAQNSPDTEPSTGSSLTHNDEAAPEVLSNLASNASWSSTNLFGLFGIAAIAAPYITIVAPDKNNVNGLIAIMLAIFCWPVGIVSLLAFAIKAGRLRHNTGAESKNMRIARRGFVATAVIVAAGISLWIAMWFIA